jgi:hypothetical protein
VARGEKPFLWDFGFFYSNGNPTGKEWEELTRNLEYASAELVLFSSFMNKEVKVEKFRAERRDLSVKVLVVAGEFAENLVSRAFNSEVALVEQVLEAQKYLEVLV